MAKRAKMAEMSIDSLNERLVLTETVVLATRGSLMAESPLWWEVNLEQSFWNAKRKRVKRKRMLMEAKRSLWGHGESKMNCNHGSMDEFSAMAEVEEQERDVIQDEAGVISNDSKMSSSV